MQIVFIFLNIDAGKFLLHTELFTGLT